MADIAALFRLAGAGFVLARAGAFSFFDPETLPAGPRNAVRLARLVDPRGLLEAERAERMREALHRLGPSYVKLGQFLATRPDFVGDAAAAALGKLRDELPPFPDAEARAVVSAALGRPIEATFVAFSPPVAAASIAQVHKAEIVAGDGKRRDVAVKILRPGVRSRFRRDLRTFFAGAHFVERFDPASRRLRPVTVVETLARSVAIEMDLRLEAAALSEMAELVAGDEGFRVPKVEWALTARDVLTLEWIDGIRLSDLAQIDAAGLDRKLLARRLMQAFLKQALRDGFFHADMHQGNFFVDRAGTIVAIDFGIMGRLGPAERRFLAEILYGFITRDYRRVAEVHFEAGYVPRNHAVDDFAQAIRAIGEPIHGQSARDISMARLLTLLFEVTEIFDMETRPELILLQKTMVVIEGVARSLDPDFDMWATSEPVIRDWIERNLGPAGQLERAMTGLASIGKLAGELPRLAERAERLSREFDAMGERGIRLDPDTVADIGRAEAREGRWGRVALWLIALAVIVVGLKVLF
ncbi:MAG TPA: 2-polyprenylphenol 6-hydroxylase [Bauldia sp.]|nr:2-polyprenylphenol 6-hydroxylase [Bauldia sp.]